MFLAEKDSGNDKAKANDIATLYAEYLSKYSKSYTDKKEYQRRMS
jgi:hypothetical protein